MPRDPARNSIRARIAHLAARIMAEDGIEDYALAKRKAARRAGAGHARDLPTNEEIEAALYDYRQLYQPEEHRDRLRALREKALQAMRRLARFDPHLTGPVLTGHAGRYAGISLQLFTDNVKAVELYLIDLGVSYRAGQSRIYAGGEPRTVPVFTFDDGDTEIELTVLSPRELRCALRRSPEGRPIERARAAAVERLLGQG